MKKSILAIALATLIISSQKAEGQTIRNLTFEETINLAESQSPNALIARNRFRSSYWQYRSFQAQYLPSVRLTGTTPDFNNSLQRQFRPSDSSYVYIQSNTLNNIGSLSLSQNIGPTGTVISLRSDLTLEKDIEKNKPINYVTTPVSINVTQPIRAFNSLKWDKKIEPVRYEQAKKTYIQAIEDVHSSAVMFFFSLASAQIDRQIAVMNLANSDTLYKIASGRFQLGTISEDELLQMELQYLNTQTSMKTAEMNLRNREIRLRSFLGFNDQVRLQLVLPNEIPDLQVDPGEVLTLAIQNNPDIIAQKIQVLTAQSNLAQAKANKGLNANLTASLGLNQQNVVIEQAYQDLNRAQRVRLTFSLPILDWGQQRGRFKMAQSNLELTNVQVNQALVDFEQNLALDVDQFNLQKNQVQIAAKSDTVAMRRYEVTKQRFLIGKIDVLDLNDADARKDQNRRAYVQALQNYWNYFYNMRALTLYDFINRKPIETDYEKLLE
ncbi:MAG TPA: TolC family protein [Bacteroidales bacterium]|jgi:outer membrane protein TolC|nr:TolC family protein [Bacteroidales bacterium]